MVIKSGNKKKKVTQLSIKQLKKETSKIRAMEETVIFNRPQDRKEGREMNELTINGEVYAKKTEPTKIKVVRSYAAGVFFGELVSEKHEVSGLVVEMKNARRIWYWKGAASLSQLAQSGVTCPDECKFPEIVDSVKLMNVVEILDVTDTALKSLHSVPVWKM